MKREESKGEKFCKLARLPFRVVCTFRGRTRPRPSCMQSVRKRNGAAPPLPFFAYSVING